MPRDSITIAPTAPIPGVRRRSCFYRGKSRSDGLRKGTTGLARKWHEGDDAVAAGLWALLPDDEPGRAYWVMHDDLSFF